MSAVGAIAIQFGWSGFGSHASASRILAVISHPFRRIKHFIREEKLSREAEAGYSTRGATLFSQQSSMSAKAHEDPFPAGSLKVRCGSNSSRSGRSNALDR